MNSGRLLVISWLRTIAVVAIIVVIPAFIVLIFINTHHVFKPADPSIKQSNAWIKMTTSAPPVPNVKGYPSDDEIRSMYSNEPTKAIESAKMGRIEIEKDLQHVVGGNLPPSNYIGGSMMSNPANKPMSLSKPNQP